MDRKLKLKVGAGVAAAAAVAGGGAALAADRFGSSSDSQAVVNDAAKQLGVTPSALSSALKKALENRIDAAVAAGRLTKAQEQQILSGLKQRITDFVNGVRDREHEFRFGRGFAGPPPGLPPPDSAAA